MTVREVYNKLCERIPESLREPWDNDGLMCASDDTREVHRALVTLDVTEEVVDYAIANRFDLILSHHPLIFKPLGSLSEDSHVARKVIRLIKSDIAVISLHTRADKVEGGVNDTLCDVVGIKGAIPFGEGDLGRIGTLDEEYNMEDFSYMLKDVLGCDGIRVADACIPIQHVAVVGGDGKSYVREALAMGADTYISGRIGYNVMTEASEMGINLIEAGHFFTEQPVTAFFQSLLMRMDADMYIEILDSNVIRLVY
ncbi:MAG: Nif3-like dinuclear metal center hexameric protein [Clostridia bacterium]|nr:Nif3-like dinuclear metal center hexameric protein [Clostridia bacterium]